MHELKKAVRRLKLEKLALCPYMLRHGGASHDCATKVRNLREVQHRGGWRSFAGVQRHNKHGRLDIVWRALIASQRHTFTRIEETLAKRFVDVSRKRLQKPSS